MRVRGSSWELGALGEPSLDFAPGVRSEGPGRETESDRKVVSPAGRMFRGGGCGPPGSSTHPHDLVELGPPIRLEVDLAVPGALDDRGPGLAVLGDPEKAAAIGLLDPLARSRTRSTRRQSCASKWA